MTRQAAEQVVAGVVVSEQLATSAYGLLHRAQWRGERNLRGLVVNANLMASDIFQVALTDRSAINLIARLTNPHIAAIVTVESAGRSAVVVTRGSGQCAAIVDLLTEGRSRSLSDGKFSIPVAGAIARSIAQALAVAHDADVIHGAVHPRSVRIGQDGVVQLDDFVVAHALRRAAAHGELPAVWRGLAGYMAPELVSGRPPTTTGDLFAVGALMSAMVTGEPPPGAIYATPGIERFIRRAIDVDPQRRHPSAAELLADLHEAMEDDRWPFAESNELRERAGLSVTGGNVDDATEDLLAALADSPAPSTRPRRRSVGTEGLDALLGDLGGDERADSTDGHDDADDLDDVTHVTAVNPLAAADPVEAVVVQPIASAPPASPVMRTTHARAPQQSGIGNAVTLGGVDDFETSEAAPRLTSRMPGIVGLIALTLVGYFIYRQYTGQQRLDVEAKQRAAESQRAADEKQRQAVEDLPDPGSIRVTSNPPQAGVWLKIGRTPVKSFQLSSAMMHELRLEGVDGYDPVDTQVVGSHWSGSGQSRTAAIAVTLARSNVDARTGKFAPVALPPMPPKPPPTRDSEFRPGHGAIQITSTPPGAEVWMYIGMTNNVDLQGIQAGLPYELRLLLTGYRPGFISVTADEWRSGGDGAAPIDRARKRSVLEKSIDLVPDPAATAPRKPSRGRG